jgi:hypothetical protein
MPRTYIGGAETFTGIPTLILSDLPRVQDDAVRTCLYEIRNYANSIGQVSGVTTGTATPTLGSNFPGIFSIPAFWCQLSYHGNKAWIPVWV